MVDKHNCEVFAFDPTIGRMRYPTHLAGSIRYHKMGIWNSSGSSKSFLLVEHLFDTMRRLNHSYIDILKVDIEGAEWTVFRDLMRPRASKLSSDQAQTRQSLPLPFGQLLIELHFESVATTVDFFRGLSSLGYRVFSREINLQPCLTGQKPVAVEYCFINPSVFFASTGDAHVAAASLITPPVVTPSWHAPIKAVIYFLTRRSRVLRMQVALQSLYDNFYAEYPHYHVLIFHDDLSERDQSRMQKSVPAMPLKFVRIHLRLPVHLSEESVPALVTHCSPNSSTIGYRHMIMFHATGIHSYLLDKANGFSDAEYVLRLDDDSLLTAPVGYDLFKLMRENNFSYGFVNTVQDDPGCVLGLWNHTRDFLNRLNTSTLQKTSQSRLGRLVSESNMAQFKSWPEGRVIYNNFELSRLSLWKSELWVEYMRSVDISGKVYTHRWGDAPLHTIFVLLGIPLKQVHAFGDLAYRHDPFVHQPPSGLPMPGTHPFSSQSRGCSYYNGWKCGSINGTNGTYFMYDQKMIFPTGPLSPEWGSHRTATIKRFNMAQELRHQFSISSLDGIEENSAGGMKVKESTRGEDYHETHAPRKKRSQAHPASNATESTNSSSVNSHSGGSKKWWLRGRSKPDKGKVNSNRSDGDGSGVSGGLKDADKEAKRVMYTFAHVDRADYLAGTLTNMYANYAKMWKCPIVVFHAASFNDTAIARFVNEQVAVDLAGSLTFVLVDLSIYIQHEESAASSGDQDVCGSSDHETSAASRFLMSGANQRLEELGYEWFFRVADNSRLLESLHYDPFVAMKNGRWRYGFISMVRDNPTCVQGLWEAGRAVCASLGNCSDLRNLWPEGVVVFTNFEISHASVWHSPVFASLVRLRDLTSGVRWGDAAVHTVSAISSLHQSEIHRFEDIRYEALMNPTGTSHTADKRQDKWKTKAAVVQAKFIESMNAVFRPRRFGWMGGDVAASFALPSEQCSPYIAENIGTTEPYCNYGDPLLSRYIWLFGDTVVGTSSGQR